MDWLAENWFFLLVLIAFIALHLFGHGHGGHGRHQHEDEPAHGRSGPSSEVSGR